MSNLTYVYSGGDTIHENVILKMIAGLSYSDGCTAECLGLIMQERGCDDLTDGGFWLLNPNTNEMFFSDKFLLSFGYDRTDFINPTFEQLYGFAIVEDLKRGEVDLTNILTEKSQRTFINNVRYNTKDSNIQEVECSGTVFFIKDEPVMVLGTHKIL